MTEKKTGRYKQEDRTNELQRDTDRQTVWKQTDRAGKRPDMAGFVFLTVVLDGYLNVTDTNRCRQVDSRQTAKASTSVS